jgi:hypothetical protein
MNFETFSDFVSRRTRSAVIIFVFGTMVINNDSLSAY